jgi:hypothetical protein
MLKECKVCLGEHDVDIHAATLSVRNWCHFDVTKWLEDETVLPIFEAEEPVLATVAA